MPRHMLPLMLSASFIICRFERGAMLLPRCCRDAMRAVYAALLMLERYTRAVYAIIDAASPLPFFRLRSPADAAFHFRRFDAADTTLRSIPLPMPPLLLPRVVVAAHDYARRDA